MTDPCPLSLGEARAILLADAALEATYDLRQSLGCTLGSEEANAWIALVARAQALSTMCKGGAPGAEALISPSVPYPGGNEPDFQTLFIEAVAVGKRGTK